MAGLPLSTVPPYAAFQHDGFQHDVFLYVFLYAVYHDGVFETQSDSRLNP
jgi:hypothetical protein